MRFDILTLFPEIFPPVLESSVLGRAVNKELLEFRYINIRDYAHNKHRRVDDYPYGGGVGMVMQPTPIFHAYQDVLSTCTTKPLTIFLSPRGKVFDQNMAKEIASHDHVVLICGHYEGIDQRIIDEIGDYELSVGDFVLTGGELGAMIVCDAVSRLIPGVLAQEASYTGESHYNGLLEHPQYTRPEVYHGMRVPQVLLCGNHKQIEAWQQDASFQVTNKMRPDLFHAVQKAHNLSQIPSVKKESIRTALLVKDCDPLLKECYLAQCKKQGIVFDEMVTEMQQAVDADAVVVLTSSGNQRLAISDADICCFYVSLKSLASCLCTTDGMFVSASPFWAAKKTAAFFGISSAAVHLEQIGVSAIESVTDQPAISAVLAGAVSKAIYDNNFEKTKNYNPEDLVLLKVDKLPSFAKHPTKSRLKPGKATIYQMSETKNGRFGYAVCGEILDINPKTGGSVFAAFHLSKWIDQAELQNTKTLISYTEKSIDICRAYQMAGISLLF